MADDWGPVGRFIIGLLSGKTRQSNPLGRPITRHNGYDVEELHGQYRVYQNGDTGPSEATPDKAIAEYERGKKLRADNDARRSKEDQANDRIQSGRYATSDIQISAGSNRMTSTAAYSWLRGLGLKSKDARAAIHKTPELYETRGGAVIYDSERIFSNAKPYL